MNKRKVGKLIVIAVLSIAFVLYTVAAFSALGLMNESGFDTLDTLVGGGTTSAIKASFWMYLGISLGLLLSVVALTFKLLDRGEIAPFIFIAAGAAAMICIFVSFMANADHLDALKASMEAAKAAVGTPLEITHKAAKTAYYKEIIIPIINLIVYAVLPCALGVKGLLKRAS